MEENHETDKLLAARAILRNSIEKSRNMAVAIDAVGSRLEERQHNFAFLHADLKDLACKCDFYEIRGHVNRAIGPSTSVLKVLDVVESLKDSLEKDLCTDVYTYIATIRRLEEALKLLANNCRLVIMWLDDVVQFLASNAAVVDDWYIVKVKKILKILMELQGKEDSFQQSGGVLSLALDKLESTYKRLLTKNTSIGMFSYSLLVVQELQAITQVLGANNRLNQCLSIYAEVRVANLQANFRVLNLEYLNIHLSESDSAEIIEKYVDLWDDHMEFAVRHLLRNEYCLCTEVYGVAGSDVSMSCFSKISIQCGFLEIFRFGSTVTICKKETAKLLMLLKVFATLDKLRLDFNEMFTGGFCMEIQNETRDLVKKVVDGVGEIFWELSVQVQLQRTFRPPLDGSVPRLVHFVTEYCNEILAEENRLFLDRILEIHQVWNSVGFGEGILSNEIHKIMKELEINLETWAKSYEDNSLSCIFMMNNYWYLYKNVMATNLGDLMGPSWLSQLEESVEYYSKLYMRESWEKLMVLLCEEDLYLFPGGRAIDRNLVKKRISVFCEAFDGICHQQSKWILLDDSLRWKTEELVVEAIVLRYKSYTQKYLPELEHDPNTGTKYSAENLENSLGSLFQPKFGRHINNKCTDLVSIKNTGTGRFSSTPAAA